MFKFLSTKSYVMHTHSNLIKTVLMSTHNIGFGRDITAVEYHHSLLSGDLKCCYLCLNSGRVENIVRKEENACNENFLIFPHYSI